MKITEGTKLGRYEIRSKIGEGGMGEVYRAFDPKIGREVAIKVLPEALTNDRERLARFEQEAQAAGSLNHPNILSIFDIDTHEDAPYLVSELLDGVTLREKLDDGPVSQRISVQYAEHIANGLAAAHEKGIIHRDLKPENIFITNDERMKILDFGLAKLTQVGGNDNVSADAPTRKIKTDPGMVMGTIGYMSPEQVRGVAVDHRSDLFSLGTILYEMLTGTPAFRGETGIETLNAILKEDPPEFAAVSARSVTPSLESVVRHCLEKRPERRFQSASDVAFALGALSGSSGSAPTVIAHIPARKFDRERLPWIAAAVFLLASLALLPFAIGYLNQPKRESSAVVRYDVSAPAKTALNLIRWPSVAISPDGSALAFVASSDGISRLYVRRRDDPEVKLLPGTEGASGPSFSPDGKWLAFVSDFTLKKASLDGSVTALVKGNDTRGLSWAGNDSIIYTPHVSESLYQISANGGEPRQVSKLDESKRERTHRWPQVLPGAKAVLFTVGTLNSPDDYESSNIEAVVLATGERRVLLQGASMARYSPTGHLVFARGGSLFAVGFDPDTLTTHGTPFTVLQGVAGDQTTGMAHFSISDDGTLAYIPGSPGANLRQLVWADRGGNSQPVNIQAAQYNDIRVSPDGSRVALLIGSSGSGDVWVYDIARETSTRLTFDTVNASPVWSSDSKSVFYTAIDPAGTKSTVLRKPADGSREAEVVASLASTAYIKAIQPDGSTAIIDYQVNTNRGNIVQLRLEQEGQMSPMVSTQFHEYGAALSPDGRWMAYQSNESGRPEIYVRDLSEAGGRWQISTAGGEEPRWSPDARELYFRNNDLFMSVAIQNHPAFQAATPENLFGGIYNLRSNTSVSYDVDPKGNRFLMIRPAGDITAPAQVRVVLNWFDELRRLAATN